MSYDVFIIAWLSFFLAAASYLWGSIAILRGPAQPSIISRFFWLMLSITNLLSYISLGAGSGIFLALASTIGSGAIFLLSLRFGYIEFKRSDVIAIVGACIALFCYLTINMKLIALCAGMMTHFISGIPTYKKTWNSPYSENLPFWVLFATASALSFMGVILQAKNVIYPLYFLLFDSGMSLLIVLQRSRLQAAKKILIKASQT